MRLKQRVDSIVGQGRRWLSRPIAELKPAERWARYALDLGGHCYRQSMRDRLPQMAAALTYRTLFGLIPLVVVSIIVFRAFGGFSGAGNDLLDNLLSQLGISNLTITAQSESGDVQQLTADQALQRTSQWVDQIDFGGIGIVGVIVLTWASIALVVTVEGCFNTIYNAPVGRSWYLRVPIYWAVITLGPVLLAASFYLTSKVITQTESLPLLGEAVSWLSRFTAVVANWILLMVMYTLLPNTNVRIRSAAFGAVIAAVVFEVGKTAFSFYVDRAVTISTIYGTLGLIPLFLLWLYITWILILLGLELSYALQTLPRGRIDQQQMLREDELTLDAHWLIPMTATIAQAFERGDRITTEEIARRLQLPPRQVRHAAEHLLHETILHRVESESETDPGYTLALPPDRIELARLLSLGQTIGRRLSEGQSLPGASLLNRILARQKQDLNHLTLAEVIHGDSQPTAASGGGGAEANQAIEKAGQG